LPSLLAAPRPWRARTPRTLAAPLVAACAALTLLLGACAPGRRPETTPVPRADRADVPAPAPIAHALAVEPTALAPTVKLPAPAPLPHQAHLPGVTFDLDVHEFEREERVQHYVRLFTGSARATFAEWMARGARYDAMIRAKLRAGGLPEDLRFLPLVESGYDVHAVSRASAVGMWQFMAPTARDVGLRVDWWVDERRDPVRATDAAVRMLRWLKSEFGSFFVAAAAYNGGPGRVSRGLAQLAAASDSALGDARFFSLVQHDYIRPETKNYVPQLIAAALIGNEPARYQLSVREAPAFAYDSAVVPALTPLAAVAKAAGVSRAALLDLNPHFLRGVTPPDARATVRLPRGAGDDFATRFSRLDARDRKAFRRATTKRRDALAAIAAREDVPVSIVAALNPRLETVERGKYKGRIVSGQAVRLPTPAVLAYARGSVADAAAGDEPGPLPPLAAEPVKEGSAGDAKPGGKTERKASKDAREDRSTERKAERGDSTVDGQARDAASKVASSAKGAAPAARADTSVGTTRKRTSGGDSAASNVAATRSAKSSARAGGKSSRKSGMDEKPSRAGAAKHDVAELEAGTSRSRRADGATRVSKGARAKPDAATRPSAKKSNAPDSAKTGTSAAKSGSPRVKRAKSDAPKSEAAKSETAKSQTAKPATKRDAARSDGGSTTRDRAVPKGAAKAKGDARARERAAEAPAARKRSASTAEQ
jgi:membrane-bound lytic murein transglycosylase D